jgi:hypothetical protein
LGLILSDSKQVFDTWLSFVIYVPLSRLATFVGYLEINNNIFEYESYIKNAETGSLYCMIVAAS